MLTSNLVPVYDQLTRQQSLGPVNVFQTFKIVIQNNQTEPPRCIFLDLLDSTEAIKGHTKFTMFSTVKFI